MPPRRGRAIMRLAMNTQLSPANAAALLRAYAEAGVDCALDETAHDCFAQIEPAPAKPVEAPGPLNLPPRAAVPQPQAPARPQAAPRSEAMISPDAAAASAREIAAGCGTLDELKAALAAFEGCALKHTATQLVFADGAPGARVMLVGEAPGRDEDMEGLPFVGRSGQLLNRILAAIGLDRTKVYIANVIPWRPPGNRTPTPQETAICKPFIARQIELSRADFLVCLGGPSVQTLLEQKDGILRLRGRWFDYRAGARTIPALATLHPAYLLRQPAQKKLAWKDFCTLRARL